MTAELSYTDALKKAQEYCAKEEKCRADVNRKLREWGADSENYEKIIEALVNDDFINEQRYAQFFAHDKFKFNKWGKIKIAYELRLKKIPITIINSAINGIDMDAYFTILETDPTNHMRGHHREVFWHAKPSGICIDDEGR